jgi:hypothetical protein
VFTMLTYLAEVRIGVFRVGGSALGSGSAGNTKRVRIRGFSMRGVSIKVRVSRGYVAGDIKKKSASLHVPFSNGMPIKASTDLLLLINLGGPSFGTFTAQLEVHNATYES